MPEPDSSNGKPDPPSDEEIRAAWIENIRGERLRYHIALEEIDSLSTKRGALPDDQLLDQVFGISSSALHPQPQT